MLRFLQNLLKKSEKPTPPKKLTDTPWREPSLWNDEKNEALLEELNQLQPVTEQNILILGPVGAGKSSFISSVVSIDKGRKFGMASSGDTGFASSWTFDLAAYSGGKLLRGYRLFDCMGIEPSDKQGFRVDDLINLIKGHVQKGYMFNPVTAIHKDHPSYRTNPTFKDQMHCVIFVVSATSVHAGLPDQYVQKIKQLQEMLNKEHIPRVLILTKVDLLCEEVAEDITKTFRSIKVQDTVKMASELFGIEKASIHPVMNYESDFNICPEVNIPILLALRQAMHYSADRVDYYEHENSDDSGQNN